MPDIVHPQHESDGKYAAVRDHRRVAELQKFMDQRRLFVNAGVPVLIQCPASLLGIGIGFFVEMWEIPFVIKERNPACRGTRWMNRRYVSWLVIEMIEFVRSAEDGCMFGVVGRGVF
jgi:hypothetical protein